MGTPYDWAIERKSSEMHSYCVVTQDGDIGHLTFNDAKSLKDCHDRDVALITDRAESAERAVAEHSLTILEQTWLIKAQTSAYEQKCRQLDAAIKHAEAAESQLKKAMSLLADDRLELCSHSSHWDDTRQGGRGCPVCIKQRKIQNEIWEFEREVNGH